MIFWDVFPFFPRILEVPRREKSLFFWRFPLLFFQKKQGLEGQGSFAAIVVNYYDHSIFSMAGSLGYYSVRPPKPLQKVGFVWSVSLSISSKKMTGRGQTTGRGGGGGTYHRRRSTPFLGEGLHPKNPLRHKLALVGRPQKCQQKVCSSKWPPKLEPRSVRQNEVFENLCM